MAGLFDLLPEDRTYEEKVRWDRSVDRAFYALGCIVIAVAVGMICKSTMDRTAQAERELKEKLGRKVAIERALIQQQ